MDKLVVEGGFQLNGSITSSGAKNSALPILAASILLDDPIIIRNNPKKLEMNVGIMYNIYQKNESKKVGLK